MNFSVSCSLQFQPDDRRVDRHLALLFPLDLAGTIPAQDRRFSRFFNGYRVGYNLILIFPAMDYQLIPREQRLRLLRPPHLLNYQARSRQCHGHNRRPRLLDNLRELRHDH